MRGIYTFLLFLVASSATAAMPKLVFDQVPVIELVRIYYSDVAKKNFLIDDSALAINKRMSLIFQGGSSASYLRMLKQALQVSGLTLVEYDGLDVIVSKQVAESSAPLHFFVYQPKHREASQLIDQLRTFFADGQFTVQRPVPSSNQPLSDEGASANISRRSDFLTFKGAKHDIARLRDMLSNLDIPERQATVQILVYEFQSGTQDSSALKVVGDLLGGKLGFSGGLSQQGDASLRLDVSGLSVIAEVLKTDERFKVVSRPFLSVKSGSAARFQSGSDVPVLGSVSQDKNGNPIQSIEYRSSGVILDVTPSIHEQDVELAISQQLSDFSQTQIGVNSSPTLNKRELRTTLVTKFGEVVVLGGLKSERHTESKRWLPFFRSSFPLSASSDERSTELVILLQLQPVVPEQG